MMNGHLNIFMPHPLEDLIKSEVFRMCKIKQKHTVTRISFVEVPLFIRYPPLRDSIK